MTAWCDAVVKWAFTPAPIRPRPARATTPASITFGAFISSCSCLFPKSSKFVGLSRLTREPRPGTPARPLVPPGDDGRCLRGVSRELGPKRGRTGSTRTVGRRHGRYRGAGARHGSPGRPLAASHTGDRCPAASSRTRRRAAPGRGAHLGTGCPVWRSQKEYRHVRPGTQGFFRRDPSLATYPKTPPATRQPARPRPGSPMGPRSADWRAERWQWGRSARSPAVPVTADSYRAQHSDLLLRDRGAGGGARGRLQCGRGLPLGLAGTHRGSRHALEGRQGAPRVGCGNSRNHDQLLKKARLPDCIERDRLSTEVTEGAWMGITRWSPACRLAASHLQGPKTLTTHELDHLLSLVAPMYRD
jgi:hypothetical protein